jgi:hypothetical protein
MTSKIPLASAGAMLFVGLLASNLFVVSKVAAQSAKWEREANSTGRALSPVSSAPHSKVSPYRPTTVPQHARNFYHVAWGVDSFSVKAVESGEMIRFSYRVTDSEKASALNDKKSSPYLIDEKARVKLEVPTLEKVGQLRQSSTPEAGKSYWMAFSNKGRIVQRGDHVSVVIGRFRADGLVVE